ncbi:MAG TPA: hypothetical protein VEB68_13155 [Croceibacterium sp.]|nr:hypothetical protein [Croceibacterium sp.]
MAMTAQPGGTWRESPWRLVLYAIPTGLLIAPAAAMQLTAEVQWTAFDFVFAAVLLYGTTGLVDLALRKGGSVAYRFGAALAVLIAFLLVWINGAVGMIGDEDNPANLMFLGVILVAVAGSALARLRARGMARAMLAAAAAQAAIAALVPLNGWGSGDPPGTVGLTLLIGTFALLWGLSAALFAKAAHDEREIGEPGR